MEKPIIRKECVKTLLETRFIKVYDLQYREGKHYFDATRRPLDEIAAIKDEKEFQSMLPDAVTCFVILKMPDGDDRLLLFYEYRYPTGQFLLSVPAGLIDPEDKNSENALLNTASREIFEETGIRIGKDDKLSVLDHLVFSTPGMTDESNGLVCAVLEHPDLKMLSQDGAEGSECFNGFELVSKDHARKLLKKGRDDHGNFYSVYTWAALTYFLSDLWKNDED